MCIHVHISATKWWIVGYGTGALWDLLDGSITHRYLLKLFAWEEEVCINIFRLADQVHECAVMKYIAEI